jgi:hypothetical protein
MQLAIALTSNANLKQSRLGSGDMVGDMQSQARSLVKPPVARPTRLRYGVADIVQCPLPRRTPSSGRDERFLQTLPIVQYGISLSSLTVRCEDAIVTSRSQ